jgi:hypothetical protein
VTLDDLRHGARLDRLVAEIAAIDGVVDVAPGRRRPPGTCASRSTPPGTREARCAPWERRARGTRGDPGPQPISDEPFVLTCEVVDDGAP